MEHDNASVINEAAGRLLAHVTVDGSFGEPLDVPLALSTTAHLTGHFSYVAEKRLTRYVSARTLIPAGAAVVRSRVDADDFSYIELWEGDGWLAYVAMNAIRGGTVMTYAASRDGARAALEAIVAQVPADEEVPDHQVEVSFHYQSSRGVTTTSRRIESPSWDAIRSNYTTAVAADFDRLMAMKEPATGGKLLLLYGPPGTGKTTALQALARQWRSWCRVSYVLDADNLFTSMDYLHSLILNEGTIVNRGDDDSDDDFEFSREQRWRLIVIEDADELIGANARALAGQALSRLLNLTDGVVGKGLRTLVAITTNEPVTNLHKAVIRPGRCLAEINVGNLTAQESRVWLGADFGGSYPTGESSLAELYALREPSGAVLGVKDDSGTGTGQYL